MSAVALAGMAALTSGALAQSVPTAFDPNRFAVTNAAAARRLFHEADRRRVDFAIIGDSNVRNAGNSGHEDGMHRALSARFGCYSTRVEPLVGRGAWGGLIGASFAFGYPPLQLSDAPIPEAPTSAMQYGFPSDWFPNSFAYLPAGVSLPDNYNAGFKLEIDHLLGTANALRYHLTHYRSRTPTDGQLVLSARGPYNVNFAAGEYPTSANVPGLTDITLDIPAGPRDPGGLMVVPCNFLEGTESRGPFFGLWHRIEATQTLTGIAYSPLLYQGGRSARDACIALNGTGPSSPALREWVRQTVRLQGDAPMLCVQVIQGGNDQGDHNPSVGPIGGLDSSTAQGQVDNMRGVQNNMRGVWAALGYDPANLYFILGPVHPKETHIDLLREYEAQWTILAAEDPNTIVVAGSQLSTEEEFAANGWFRTTEDHSHLSPAGYRAWGVATIEALQRATCPADMNHDRVCGVQDVFEFLVEWFAGTAKADFDGSGQTPGLDDLFGFLEAWFEGC